VADEPHLVAGVVLAGLGLYSLFAPESPPPLTFGEQRQAFFEMLKGQAGGENVIGNRVLVWPKLFALSTVEQETP
jgi:hypothetical protein